MELEQILARLSSSNVDIEAVLVDAALQASDPEATRILNLLAARERLDPCIIPLSADSGHDQQKGLFD